VPDELREHRSQVSLPEDQHVVGEFGSGGEHEPLGEAVCPRATRRDLHDRDACIGQDRIERRGELAVNWQHQHRIELSGADQLRDVGDVHEEKRLEQLRDHLVGPDQQDDFPLRPIADAIDLPEDDAEENLEDREGKGDIDISSADVAKGFF